MVLLERAAGVADQRSSVGSPSQFVPDWQPDPGWCLSPNYEVAREFESHSLRQRVFSFRVSLDNRAKSARLAGISPAGSTGEMLTSSRVPTFRDSSPWAFYAVDLGFCREPTTNFEVEG
jgi:hypothetical protein